MADVPKIPVPDVANIPQVMQAAHRWCNWKYDIKKDGKLTKVPVNPHTGGVGSSTNPDTWSSLGVAYARARQSIGSRGLGFMLGGGWAGIDLDHVIREGEILPWAQEVLAYFGQAYQEYSPSMAGIHCVFLGEDTGPARGQWDHKVYIPVESGQAACVEFYVSKRFFTVTGATLGATPEGLGPYDTDDARQFRAHIDEVLSRTRESPRTHAGEDSRTQHAGEDSRTHAGEDSRVRDIEDVELETGNPPDPAKFAAVMQRTRFRNHWEQKSSPKGAKEDGNSERALGMASICAHQGWTAQEVCDLLQYWCAETGQEPYHRSKMEHTLSKAFNHTSTVEDAPTDLSDTTALKLKVADRLGLVIQSLVQIGKDDAHYELTLSSGAVRRIETYKLYQLKGTWDELADTEAVAQGYAAKKSLTAKEWPEVFQWIKNLCTYEESHETDPTEETRFWVGSVMDGTKAYADEESVGLHDWQSGRFRLGNWSYIGIEPILTHVRNLGTAQTVPQMVKRLKAIGFHNANVTWKATGDNRRFWTDDPRITLRVGTTT